MTLQRRAPHGLVVGAALAVLLVLSACADGTQVAAGSDSDMVVPAATAVATTAPAQSPLPESVLPSPVAVPTAAPPNAELSVEEPTVVPAIGTPDPSPPATEPPAASEVASPPPPTPVSPTPVSPTPVSPTPVSSTDSRAVLAANGSEIYTLTCARCHGENGLGSAQYSAGLIGVGSKYSTQAMIAELTTGHPVTFGFTDRLTTDEIAAVVAYVKSVFP